MYEPKVFIIAPVRNRVQTTLKFIEYIKNQTYKNYELIVIDDASTDGTYEQIKKNYNEPWIKLIPGNGNLWWAGGLQTGLEYVDSITNKNENDIILFMNDDVQFEIDFIKNAIDVLSKSKNTFLCAQNKNEETHEIEESGIEYNPIFFKFKPAKNKNQINCMVTRGLFFKVEDFKKIGGLFPKILPHYLSDYEFTYRAYKKGMKLITNDNVWLIPDYSKTGFQSPEKARPLLFFKRLFTKRNAYNPYYMIIFIILANPVYLWPFNFIKVFLVFAKSFLIAFGLYPNAKKA